MKCLKIKRKPTGRIRSFMAGMLLATAIVYSLTPAQAVQTCPSVESVLERHLTLLIQGDEYHPEIYAPERKPEQ